MWLESHWGPWTEIHAESGFSYKRINTEHDAFLSDKLFNWVKEIYISKKT